MGRKQFTFYRSIYESAQDMSEPLERLALYEAVIEFGLFEKEPEDCAVQRLSGMKVPCAIVCYDSNFRELRFWQDRLEN